LNAPCIQRIIHCKPPTTMEKYMQEIGRAGRNGQEADAIMFYTMREWVHHKIVFPSTHVLNTDRNTQDILDFLHT
jgi:superfamily II DNA helicase RecQ